MPKHITMPVAVHLLLKKGNEVLLLRRFNTGYEDGNFSVVAGHVDGGETVQAAMIREAAEEAGVQIDAEDIHIVLVMHRRIAQENAERIDYFLCCEKWQGEPVNREPHKCDLLEWHDMSNLPQNTIAYVRSGIESYLKNKQFISFGF